jgi:hypothetical protein
VRTVETRFSVPQSPDQVWSVLIDFASYARWNSFLREASGEVRVGKKLTITLYSSSGIKMSFKPRLLVIDKDRELRWMGHLIVNGMFDGAVAEPATPLMKSRRRIALLRLRIADWGSNGTITAGICGQRNGIQRSRCAAAIIG